MATRNSSRIKENLARKAAQNTPVTAERNGVKSSMPPPAPPPTHGSLLRDAEGYLQRIYTAADQIYRRGTPKPRTTSIVNDIVIYARCARILTHLPAAGRAAYLAEIARSAHSLDGQSRVIAEHMQRIGQDDVTRRRFSDFVDSFGSLLLSICAHSKSFRFILTQAHTSSRNRTLWRDLCPLIKDHAYSIELYARTRGLDWNTPLAEGSDDWNQLICGSLHNVLEQHRTFAEAEVLGISDHEYRIRHELPDDMGHCHEWVVPAEPRTAYNPEMTYRPRRGKSPKVVTEKQVNIDRSNILEKPVWVNRRRWPIDDPRYRGPFSAPCEVCQKQISDETVAVDDCNHTWTQLCKFNHSKIAKASSRVELLKYPKKGVGVRALKAFRKNEILAEYVGDIYPAYIVRKDSAEEVKLYPNDNGLSYRYQQELEMLDIGGGQKRKTPSPKLECNTMTIDPAIRGNWTRYMNHSCRPATKFDRRFIGDRKWTLVVASRNIRFAEEITVHYGLDYWKEAKYGCACGEDLCTL